MKELASQAMAALGPKLPAAPAHGAQGAHAVMLPSACCKLMPACPGRLNTYPEHAMTPSVVLGVAAFKAFLTGIQEDSLYYGPVLGWAWVRGLKFQEVNQEGFDTYMVPVFGAGEYDQVGQAWMLQGQGMQHHDMSHSGKHGNRCTSM